MSSTTCRLMCAGAVSVAASFAMSPALAADNANAETVSSGPAVEEVLVTAQRRSERLQDVPISVSVIGGEEMSTGNINSLEALSQRVPSVHIASTVGRSGEIYMRGVGSGNTQSFDQSVATFVDGIYQGRIHASAAALLDLRSVEVLKGPQSTFFGMNAIAGAYNITTNGPTNRFEASLRTLYGSYGQYAVEGVTSGPLTDSLSGRIAVITNGTDGWIRNIALDEDMPRRRNTGGRLSFKFEPNDAFDATLKIEASRNRDDSGQFFQVDNCPPPEPFPVGATCRNLLQLGQAQIFGLEGNSVNAGGPGNIDLDTFSSVLTANYSWDDYILTSVTGFSTYDYLFNFWAGQQPTLTSTLRIPENYQQFSQEFRITSPSDRRITYLAGAYFQADTLDSTFGLNLYSLSGVIQSRPPLAPIVPYLPYTAMTAFKQDQRVYSVFGAATLNATDRLRFTLGLRGTEVRKDFDWSLTHGTATSLYGGFVPLPPELATVPNSLGVGVAGAASLSRKDRELIPSLDVQYTLSSAAMAYVSYREGFKAGGFNAGQANPNLATFPFEPERVEDYEAGVKSELFDRTLRLNVNLFWSEYSNLQVVSNLPQVGGGILSFVNNAGSVRSRGVELDGEWVITDAFRVFGAATHLDSKYQDYRNGSPTQLNLLNRELFQDLSGRRTSYAPQWSGSFTGSYSMRPFGDYELVADFTARFSSKYYQGLAADPLQLQHGYAAYDGKLTLKLPDGHWEFDLLLRNMTDKDIKAFSAYLSSSPGSTIFQKQDPRMVLAQARFTW